MSRALAAHDAVARSLVEARHGRVVKTTGDGIHAVFDNAPDALAATVALQQALADPATTNGVSLRVRCGLHAGLVERRDNDYLVAQLIVRRGSWARRTETKCYCHRRLSMRFAGSFQQRLRCAIWATSG
jgi:hypothetical protein